MTSTSSGGWLSVSSGAPTLTSASRRQRRAWHPTAALVVVAVIWGVTFTVADGVVDTLPPTDLVVWRFGIAAVVLGMVNPGRRRLPKEVRLRAALLGLLLGSGFVFQAWALTFTDALLTGFLTGLLVIIAPVAGWLLFRERMAGWSWFGVALAGAGVVVLGFRGAEVGTGELLILASTVVWGLHVVLMSRWSQAEHAWAMARTQTGVVFAVAGVLLAGHSLATGHKPLPVLPVEAVTWGSLLFLALLATAGAMVLLSWAQSRVAATRAAVVLTLEPAVSGLTATLTGSVLTTRVVVGAVLLVGAMVVVETVRTDS